MKREPTCSALKLYSWYSGIPALQSREDVNLCQRAEAEHAAWKIRAKRESIGHGGGAC
jgi:hypothetical protein